MKTLLYATALVLVAGCTGSKDGAASTEPAKPAFKNLVLTDDESSKKPGSTFGVTTPKIFVFFDFENVGKGSALKGTWICEKSEAAPPNYKIDEATIDVGLLTNTGNFSLSKPTNGWPVGTYRVELSIDNKLMDTVKFSVAK